MKILVTGVAGFIGFNFSKFLLEKTNFDIIGVDNLNDYYSVNVKKSRLKVLKESKKFNFIKLDIKNKYKLEKVFKKKIDAVFHFAAQAGVRYSIKNPRAYIESNTLGFFNIIEFSIKNKIKKFFYASSSSVYGDSKKFPLSEKDPINPKNIYGLTKKNNEEICELLSKQCDASFIGLRFFTVFGEWGRPDMLINKYLKSIFHKKEKFYLNNFGNHTRDFTYIGDVVKIIHILMKKNTKNLHELFNICSNTPIKLRDIIKQLNQHVTKPLIIKRKFQKADVVKTHGDNKKMKLFTKFTKFEKISLGIKKTANWFLNNSKNF